jgi:small conductance mechanosensitive channel
MMTFLGQAGVADSAAQSVTEAGGFMASAMDFFKDNGPGYALQIIVAILVFVIGRMAAGAVRNGLKKVMQARGIDSSLSGFVGSLAYFGIMAFTVIAVIGRFGVQTASFVAILGAAGFAIGMALQGTLANFASGVMILLFRPFTTGDFIEAGGVIGSVKDIQIFSTTIATGDNIRITVPNGQLYGGVIKNYNGYDTRRVDMVMGIGYGSDINKAMEIIRDLLTKDERVLKDPAISIAVGELADSSVNIKVRPWVKASDYWGLHGDFHKTCKEAFDAAGIEIPFPQTVVHMNKLES